MVFFLAMKFPPHLQVHVRLCVCLFLLLGHSQSNLEAFVCLMGCAQNRVSKIRSDLSRSFAHLAHIMTLRFTLSCQIPALQTASLCGRLRTAEARSFEVSMVQITV
jgi:hypothetical protein